MPTYLLEFAIHPPKSAICATLGSLLGLFEGDNGLVDRRNSGLQGRFRSLGGGICRIFLGSCFLCSCFGSGRTFLCCDTRLLSSCSSSVSGRLCSVRSGTASVGWVGWESVLEVPARPST